MIDLPEVKLLDMPLELDETDSEGRVEAARLKEDELREAVRGIWDGADLDSFRVFYFPVYKVELMLRRKKRHLWVDGRTAKELVF